MLRKNTAGQFLGFAGVNASTGAAMTGTAGFAAYRVLDNGAQSAATGTVTDKGNGQYSFAMSQADTNGNDCSILFTMTGMVPVEKTFVTTAADPTDGQRFGLSALPTTGTLAVKPAVTLAQGDVTGKIPATVAQGDGVDAAAVRTTIGTAGAGLTNLGDTRIAGLVTSVGNLPTTSQIMQPTDVTAAVNAGSVGVKSGGITTASYASGAAPPAVSAIAAAILVNPSNLLATDNQNRVTTSNPATGGTNGASLMDIQGELNARGLTGAWVDNVPSKDELVTENDLPAAVSGASVVVANGGITTQSYGTNAAPPTASAIRSEVVTGMASAPVGSVANLSPLPLPTGVVAASPSPTSTAFKGTAVTGSTLNATLNAYAPTNKRVRFILWTSGANNGQTSSIAGYAGNGSFTLDANSVTGTIAAGDGFIVI